MTFWKKGTAAVTPIALTRNVLHLVISSTHLDGWMFSLVYNPKALGAQTQVWMELSKLARLQIPWLVASDFNAIKFEQEHRGGSFNYYTAKPNYFKDFICLITSLIWASLVLPLLSAMGRRGCVRLDRLLVKLGWMESFDLY